MASIIGRSVVGRQLWLAKYHRNFEAIQQRYPRSSLGRSGWQRLWWLHCASNAYNNYNFSFPLPTYLFHSQFDQSDLLLPSAEYYQLGFNHPIMQSYFNVLMNVATLLGRVIVLGYFMAIFAFKIVAKSVYFQSRMFSLGCKATRVDILAEKSWNLGFCVKVLDIFNS